ncbi:3-methyl-2-oxobutanoate hydroxymethyltransferase [Actinomyces sp. B33]|uniref:3-methyl-2-oxobutanoate hydroxymethyltransferase n=1 Tax=Actinomyces sp. B33 TaxID=2942131 RepID=UPI00233FC506|nr:3-methyl-2-oxobutanoate hydroxymethyltransferase [Actinomyces sp. B33]MDC4232996.1 3-methyl-2-oxobutanoate hydroxymethyltransferase [Actinomyces sp. B33]
MSRITPEPAQTPSTTGIAPGRVRIHHIAQAKALGTPITMLTAYDALTAPIFEAAGVDMLLVGDSYGNVVLGHSSTIPVTLDDMERATASVCRSVHRVMVVADLPFGTYEDDPRRAFDSAARLMRVGAHAVKLEGGAQRAPIIRALVDAGIPVCAHVGYTPQSENLLGGPRMQGRGDSRERLLADIRALEEAGAFAVVLEMVPASLAAEITAATTMATIGIGAGPATDGQVLVSSDMAGMTEWVPSFVRRFGELGAALESATRDYVESVRARAFPGEGNYRDE